MAMKTIVLNGTEASVTGLTGYNAHIRNDGTDVLYAAKTANIAIGKDEVMSIPAGGAATLYGISGEAFLLGTGSAMVVSDDYTNSPFKTSTVAYGTYTDEEARSMINSHSNNSDIHVTAEEKTLWNKKSVIPESLPANGGNADTIGNVGISKIAHGYFTVIQNADECLNSGYYMMVYSAENIPVSDYGLLVVQNGEDPTPSRTWISQTFYPASGTVIYHRMIINAAPTEWIAYVSKPDFDALVSRVKALENNLQT